MKRLFLFFNLALFTLVGMAQPHVLSHRGFYTNPQTDQNTLASLSQAQKLHREMGLEACEFDVHKTKDGVLIIHHDTKINSKLNCQHSTWAELQQYTLPMGHKIPTLREWLLQAKETPNMKISLELKKHDTPEKETDVIQDVVKMVHELGVQNQVRYLSFSVHACKEFVRLDPGCYVIYNSTNLFEPITPAIAKQMGFSAISYQVGVFLNHPEYIDEANKLGIDTYLWMVEHESLVDWATAHNVTWITTDFADRILKYTQDLAKNKKKLKQLKKRPY